MTITLYEERFQKVHQLLKDHGCKPTFDFQKDFQLHPILGGGSFYKPEQEMHSDHSLKEWREVIDACLDVCVPTKKAFSQRDKIRFDIKWSQRVHLYSMYVSLPTSARSISLSHKTYKTEAKLMVDVEHWLAKAGCKKAKMIDVQRIEVKKIEQISLF